MALYDGLPLNTPTKVKEDAQTEVWATRTVNGGTEEYRIKPGTDLDRAKQIAANASGAIDANVTYLAIVSPTTAQVTAQVKALTRQINGVLRQALGRFDKVD
jgi:hypothetical protein